MRRITTGIITIVLLLLLVASLLPAVGCATEAGDTGKTVVAVSLLPQAGFVKAVGGDKVEVIVMVPPGASPHTYEVTPEQMTQLANAKMYAKVGSPVEFELAWMDKLISVNKSMLVVDCAEGVELMEMSAEEEHEEEHEEAHEDAEHEHAGLDPHIWTSAKNAGIMVRNICDGLVQVDAGNTDYYEANCAAYLNELATLDEALSAGLADVANHSFIVFHPAFGYFARDYGLEQIAVQQEGKEPDADYIIRLIEEARERDIRVVFVSPQYSSKSAEVIASEIHGKVVIIDPLAEDFVSNMRSIEAAMRDAMQ